MIPITSLLASLLIKTLPPEQKKIFDDFHSSLLVLDLKQTRELCLSLMLLVIGYEIQKGSPDIESISNTVDDDPGW